MKQSIQYGITLLFGIMLLCTQAVWAQGLIIGIVSDENGSPLPGATVVVEETNTGTTTDFDGNYQISADIGQTLVFSYVGYESQSVSVADMTIDVQLQPANELEEVVLTGVATGTSTRKLGFTVSKISEQGLQDVPASDPGNALRAKVTGIRVVQASGNPTSAPEIRLRGSTSISGNQSGISVDIFHKAELDYILAEAYLMTNQLNEAKNLLDNSPRVTVGELPTVDLTESAIRDAIFYEYSVELDLASTIGTQWFFMRRHDLLQKGTPLHYPVPATELELSGVDFYTFGGDSAEGTASGANSWR